MGVLRWRSLLDREIANSSSQPLSKLDFEVLTALRLALYQFRWLDRIPARAATHESVELVKRSRKHSAAPFVNAVLRKLATGGGTQHHDFQDAISQASADTLAASSAHPEWLVERWIHAYGLEVARLICQHNQSVPVTSIRLRGLEAESHLQNGKIDLYPGALLALARRVKQGGIARNAAYRDSSFVIQDEASQLIALLAGDGKEVLDCCAAPGGKTLAIADRDSTAKITAIERYPHRARLLRKLLLVRGSGRTSCARIRVISADASSLPFLRKFDRVLADVPCSGTGTLSRNPEIKWTLKLEDIGQLQSRQLAILRSSIGHVTPGGRLIYSTCSLEREENDDVIERAMAENSGFHLIECRSELERLQATGELVWKDVGSLVRGPYLRTLPGVHPCDGFFAAILERNR
jgi:16S rRNA (cytosine967-C5)-methyltransferase